MDNDLHSKAKTIKIKSLFQIYIKTLYSGYGVALIDLFNYLEYVLYFILNFIILPFIPFILFVILLKNLFKAKKNKKNYVLKDFYFRDLENDVSISESYLLKREVLKDFIKENK